MTDATLTDRAIRPGRLLKMSDVVREVSLHRATIYRMIRRGEFPSSHLISRRRVVWREDEIEAWKQQALAGAFTSAA